MINIKPNFKIQAIIILLAIISIESNAIEAQSNIIPPSNKTIILEYWQIAKDPSPKGVLQNPVDSLWKKLGNSTTIDEYTVGNWLLRTNVIIGDSISTETVLGLFPMEFITAYEIYWDGKKIAQNGIIGINSTDEKAGTFNFSLPLPLHLVTTGKHEIILRISNYHNNSMWKWFYGGLLMGPYEAGLKKQVLSDYQAFFIIGILFIPFLFNLFLYIARKRRTEHLLFSIICLMVIMDSLTAKIPELINTPTTFVNWQTIVYSIITVLFACLFPAFFIYMFSFPKKIIGFIVVINLIILFFFTNIWNIFGVMTFTVLAICSMIAVWALLKRREGSIIVLIGLIAAWVAYIFNFAFAGLATVMVICTSISIARQFAMKEKAEREAQLRSAHLENELLKKNINPHFILNTLTSIIVWLRKDPKSAIKLIETLAEEFRMVTQISALRQITIRQEIDLCRAHLNIMNYRKGADYKLETVDIAEEENVPPMIFHTLVENGLTHGYENKDSGTFILRRIRNSNSVQYIITNDGDFSSDSSKNSTGFGNKYIKGRLEESYPNRWEFTSHEKERGWETIIEIKDK